MNSSKVHYAKSFLSFSLGVWLHSLISFMLTPVITYLISPGDFGRANSFVVIYWILSIIVRFGCDNAYIRFFYEYSHQIGKLLWSCICISLVLLMLLSGFLCLFWENISVFITGEIDIKIVILLYVALVIGLFQNYNMLTIKMKKKGLTYSLMQVANSLVRFFFVIIFSLFLRRKFYSIPLGQVFADGITFLISLFLEKEEWTFYKFDINIVKRVLLYSLPFTFSGLVGWIFRNIDVMLLRSASSFEKVGIYFSAQKLSGIVGLVQSGFAASWVPFAYENSNKAKQNKEFYKNPNSIVTAMFLLLASLIISFKDFIVLFLSEKYREASQILPFLVLAPVFSSISETTAIGINLSGKTYWHFLNSSVSALSNFLIGFNLIPMYGSKGAAMSVALSNLVLFVMRTYSGIVSFKLVYDLKRIFLGFGLIFTQAFISSFSRLGFSPAGFITNMLILSFIVFIYRYEIFKEIYPVVHFLISNRFGKYFGNYKLLKRKRSDTKS